jgi:hypothetical protein
MSRLDKVEKIKKKRVIDTVSKIDLINGGEKGAQGKGGHGLPSPLLHGPAQV